MASKHTYNEGALEQQSSVQILPFFVSGINSTWVTRMYFCKLIIYSLCTLHYYGLLMLRSYRKWIADVLHYQNVTYITSLQFRYMYSVSGTVV